MNNIKVSMLLVVKNAQNYIKDSIYSLINQGFKKDEFEIIIVDGKSNDKTKLIAKEILEKEKINYKILDNSKMILPAGWNIGIKEAKGKYIVRPDAHSKLLENYIKIGIEKLEKNDSLAGVGGILETYASSYIGKMIAKVLSNPIGVGSSLFRVGVKNDTYSDTAVYAVYKKEVLLKVGLFNETLTRNQDIDLHKRIMKLGYKFLTSPDMKAVYYSRTTLNKFLKQAFDNGFWVTYGKSGHLRHYIPMIFIFVLLVSAFISIKMLSIVLMLYFFAVMLSFIVKSKEFNLLNLMTLFILTFGLHLSYGIGSITGYIKRLLK